MSINKELFETLFPRAPWLETFRESLDVHLRQRLSEHLKGGRRLGFDRYQFDDLISESSGLLDRCISYRQQYDELSAAAVKAALEYELFSAQLPFSKELDQQRWLRRLRAFEVKSNLAVKTSLDAAGSEISNVFSMLADVAQCSARLALKGEIRKSRLTRQRWDAAESYQEELRKRHEEKGGALNYSGRAERVRDLLVEDMLDAWDKLEPALEGIEELFGLKYDLNSIDDSDVLTGVVNITRAVIRDLEHYTASEQRNEQIISLRGLIVNTHTQAGAFGSGTGVPLLLDFAGYLANRRLDFFFGERQRRGGNPSSAGEGGGTGKVPRRIWTEVPVGRIVAIGCSIRLLNPDRFRNPSMITATVRITSRRSTRLSSERTIEHRLPISICDVGVTSSNTGVNWTTSSSVRNTPATGDWTIELIDIVEGGDSANVTWADVADVRLHLLMASSDGQAPPEVPIPRADD